MAATKEQMAVHLAKGRAEPQQKLHDSGQRRQFEDGAVRDRGDLKPRPDLISPHAQMREGMILTLGAEKYDPRNWEKGMPISECLASAQRHIEQWKLGLTNEDHLAMARVNLGFAIHYEEEVKQGGLDPKWDDMPKYVIRWDGVELAEPVQMPRVHGLLPTSKNSVPVQFGDGKPYAKTVALTPAPPKPESRFNRVLYDRDGWRFAIHGENYHEGAEDWHFHCPYNYSPSEIPLTSANNACYVAGPMRGYDKFNFPTFDLARDLWREAGWMVISPADLDREHGFDEDNPPTNVTPELARNVMARDCAAILSLDARRGDCLVVLPGWENSKGATVEVALARFTDLPVVQAFNGEVVKA